MFYYLPQFFVLSNFRSVVLKVGGITPPGGDFEGQGGNKTKGGDGETTQRGQKRSTTNQSLS